MATSMRGILFSRTNLLPLASVRSYALKKNQNKSSKSKINIKNIFTRQIKSSKPNSEINVKTNNEGRVGHLNLSSILSDPVEIKELSYHDYVNQRINTARKTIFIKTNSIEDSLIKLKQFGKVENVCNIKRKEYNPYHMVTFSNENSINELVSSFGKHDSMVKRIIIDEQSKTEEAKKRKEVKPDLNQQLESCNSIDEQLECLYQHLRLDDVHALSIFLYFSIMQDVFNSISHGILEPFGSCVNGFGMNSSDLDINYFEVKNNGVEKGLSPSLRYNNISGDKGTLMNVSASLRSVIPIINRHLVIAARIPIIRLSLKPFDYQMDIAFPNNRQGPIISEMFYTYSLLDKRIPIIFTFIKTWALSNDVSLSNPGPWFSSFQLLALVIFFFQQRPQSTIPSIKDLIECNKRYVSSESKTKSAPLYVIRSLTKNPSFESSLETLLKEFFQYYGRFDFHTTGISLLMAQTFKKTTQTAIQCEFPFDFHNIMRNVNKKYSGLFQSQSHKALILLDKRSPTNSLWGIALCLNKTEHSKVDMKIDITKLFKD